MEWRSETTNRNNRHTNNIALRRKSGRKNDKQDQREGVRLPCIALRRVRDLSLGAGRAEAAGSLVVYCAVNEEWCRAASATYQKETGVKVDMTRMSAGEIYARLRAEKDNPQGDIWWGGTGDPHLQAANEELTDEYKSPDPAELRDWAQKQAERSKYRTVGIYLGALGYGYNTDELEAARREGAGMLGGPDRPRTRRARCRWPIPNSSGTAYTMLATIVQLMGEDKAFDYFKKLHKNIDEYTKAGAAPALAVGKGETLIGIAFQHDVIDGGEEGRRSRWSRPAKAPATRSAR